MKGGGIYYRGAEFADIPAMKEMFRATLRYVNIADYSQDEIEDWASCDDDDRHWEQLLSCLHFIVALDGAGGMAGFASFSDDGYLHSMFVSKDYQCMGIGSRLLAMAERHAAIHALRSITMEGSVTALPFFLSKGYKIEREQRRRANRMCLKNYLMEKSLK